MSPSQRNARAQMLNVVPQAQRNAIAAERVARQISKEHRYAVKIAHRARDAWRVAKQQLENLE